MSGKRSKQIRKYFNAISLKEIHRTPRVYRKMKRVYNSFSIREKIESIDVMNTVINSKSKIKN